MANIPCLLESVEDAFRVPVFQTSTRAFTVTWDQERHRCNPSGSSLSLRVICYIVRSSES